MHGLAHEVLIAVVERAASRISERMPVFDPKTA